MGGHTACVDLPDAGTDLKYSDQLSSTPSGGRQEDHDGRVTTWRVLAAVLALDGDESPFDKPAKRLLDVPVFHTLIQPSAEMLEYCSHETPWDWAGLLVRIGKERGVNNGINVVKNQV